MPNLAPQFIEGLLALNRKSTIGNRQLVPPPPADWKLVRRSLLGRRWIGCWILDISPPSAGRIIEGLLP